MGYQDSGNRSCAFHSGNLNGDNYGNNKTIQKNVEPNFTNVFDWKPFRNSGDWRCNQRVSTCEFNPVICVCQYGNRVAQSVPGGPDMQLNPCYFIQRFHKLRHYNFLVLSLFTKSTGNIAF